MKAYDGVDVRIHSVLCLALIESKWPAVRPGRFTPAERPRILGRPQGRAVDVMEKKNIYFSYPGIEPRILSHPACNNNDLA